MTDFATDQLWEEDSPEPEMVKKPPEAQPDPVAGAGNGATAQAVKEAEAKDKAAAKPMMPSAKAAPEAKATKAKTADKGKEKPPEKNKEKEKKPEKPAEKIPDGAIEPPEKKPEKPAPAPEPRADIDWQKPLNAVLKSLHSGQLDKTLPMFLKAAAHIPPPQMAGVVGMIISSFLRLPMAARQSVRAALIKELGDHAESAVAQLILIRLGGIPVAAPPPPPPPAPPSNP